VIDHLRERLLIVALSALTVCSLSQVACTPAERSTVAHQSEDTETQRLPRFTVPVGWEGEWHRDDYAPTILPDGTVRRFPGVSAAAELSPKGDSDDVIRVVVYASDDDLATVSDLLDAIQSGRQGGAPPTRRRVRLSLSTDTSATAFISEFTSDPDQSTRVNVLVFMRGPAHAPVEVIADLGRDSAALEGASTDEEIVTAVLSFVRFRR